MPRTKPSGLLYWDANTLFESNFPRPSRRPPSTETPCWPKPVHWPESLGNTMPRTTSLCMVAAGGPTMWYPIADAIVSTLETEKPPRIKTALRFTPHGVQDGLRPVNLMGDPLFRFDPAYEYLYMALIHMRGELEIQRDRETNEVLRRQIDAKLGGLKPMTNSLAHGIFLETTVETAPKETRVTVYSGGPPGKPESVDKLEVYGRFFNPLISTFVTGDGRLMLALLERQIGKHGLTWVFCDTDSMTPALAPEMSVCEFVEACNAVWAWFEPLNVAPDYGEFLELEDENFGYEDGKKGRQRPLFGTAISSKQHTLYGLDDHNRPVVRKASAHGLGHLLPPYSDDEGPELPGDHATIGVPKWIKDLWYYAAEAMAWGEPNRVRYAHLPGFDKPAVTLTSVTTPKDMKWFRALSEQPLPFSHVYTFQAHPDELGRTVGPVALYQPDRDAAARICIDRMTGEPIDGSRLETYIDVLGLFQFRPEWKMLNGRAFDTGQLQRRTIIIDNRVERVGKDMHGYDQQLATGYDPSDDPQYSSAPDDLEDLLERARAVRSERLLTKRRKGPT